MGIFSRQSSHCWKCGCGTCQCHNIAKRDRADAQKHKRPHVCGQLRRDGGTCHRTIAHGETCTARH